jgi:putative transposase
MSRIPRNLIIEEGYQTHKMWRSHNKEFNISSNDEKENYLENLVRELEKKDQDNELNAYTLMSNHVHEVFDIKSLARFCNMMRNHHSRYGKYFNNKHKRRGKVAYERPKTCLIESDEYSMTATFYIHANPLRAGLVKDACNYRWSTHRLYAYGKRDRYTRHVRFPGWYMRLGKSFEQRQRVYRELFDGYLRQMGLIKQAIFEEPFLGSALWKYESMKRVRDYLKRERSKDPP